MSSQTAPANIPARPRKPRTYHWANKDRDVTYCGIEAPTPEWKTKLPTTGPKPVLCDTCKFIADLEDELDVMYVKGRQ